MFLLYNNIVEGKGFMLDIMIFIYWDNNLIVLV